MRRIPFAQLKSGMVVGHNLYNARGDVLLNRGVPLTPAYLASLRDMGIPALYINDGFLSEMEVQELVDPGVRTEAIGRLRETWSQKAGPVITLNDDDALLLRQTVTQLLDEIIINRSAMVNLVDLRTQDDYLFAHSVNVCVLALMTGLFLGLDRSRLFDLGLGALLHDIGKLLIPKDILDKPGKLDKREFEVIKRHPTYSYEIIAGQKEAFGEMPAIVALQHHERYNGKGYPSGLLGEEIGELAQIVGIADVYDAMTADRVYRSHHQPNDVYEMLAASGDHHFGFRLVQAFLNNVAAYPTGSLVRLSSGDTAVVVRTSKAYPLHPRIKVVFDGQKQPLGEPYEVDLVDTMDICIVRVLSNEEVEELKRYEAN